MSFAVDLAERAGKVTLQYFNQPELQVDRKSDLSPVTAADKGAEELIRREIEKAFPTDSILGEEFGEKTGSSGYRWVLDPIDGTVSFISGVPLYSVLIALEHESDVLLGVIHMPALAETVCAARGLGCLWNGKPAHTSSVDDLSMARLVGPGTKLIYRQGKGAAFERLRDSCWVDRGVV